MIHLQIKVTGKEEKTDLSEVFHCRELCCAAIPESVGVPLLVPFYDLSDKLGGPKSIYMRKGLASLRCNFIHLKCRAILLETTNCT